MRISYMYMYIGSEHLRRKFSQNHMGGYGICQKFHGGNKFHRWLSNCEICEHFLSLDSLIIMAINNAESYSLIHSYPILLQLTQLRTLADQYSQLQKTLLRMLQTTWGSNHSIPDHLETSNGCLLCHGMSLWLTLANKLILKYVQIELEKQDAGKMIDQFSGVFFLPTGLRV